MAAAAMGTPRIDQKTNVVRGEDSSRAFFRKMASVADTANAAKRNWMPRRSEEHTSEFQSLRHLVCLLLLDKKLIQHCFRHQIHLPTLSPLHYGADDTG